MRIGVEIIINKLIFVYFSCYLMGDTTERPVNIEEMNREMEQSGTKASPPAGAGGRRGPEEQ